LFWLFLWKFVFIPSYNDRSWKTLSGDPDQDCGVSTALPEHLPCVWLKLGLLVLPFTDPASGSYSSTPPRFLLKVTSISKQGDQNVWLRFTPSLDRKGYKVGGELSPYPRDREAGPLRVDMATWRGGLSCKDYGIDEAELGY
jgi:hypothetical protein